MIAVSRNKIKPGSGWANEMARTGESAVRFLMRIKMNAMSPRVSNVTLLTSSGETDQGARLGSPDGPGEPYQSSQLNGFDNGRLDKPCNRVV